MPKKSIHSGKRSLVGKHHLRESDRLYFIHTGSWYLLAFLIQARLCICQLLIAKVQSCLQSPHLPFPVQFFVAYHNVNLFH
jgi:hypothetical protein